MERRRQVNYTLSAAHTSLSLFPLYTSLRSPRRLILSSTDIHTPSRYAHARERVSAGLHYVGSYSSHIRKLRKFTLALLHLPAHCQSSFEGEKRRERETECNARH